MSAVRDIRRFPRPQGQKGIGAFLRFTGFACVKGPDGRNTIQRFRRGGGMPGNPEIKQAIWLLIDLQFSRQKDTRWGLRFREIKAALKAKHPVPELICDTEIPLRKGQYTYDEGTQTCTVTFGKDKVATFTGGKILTEEFPRKETFAEKVAPELRKSNLTLVLPPRTILLPADKKQWSVTNGLYTINQPDGSVIYQPGKSQHTDGHIHKNAMWRLGTEFLIEMLHKWWEYVDMQEQARQKQLAA